MKNIWATLVCGFASIASAQVGAYLGPGVMSTGAGTIGQHGGEQVDLRFYAGVSAIYDNGITPFSITPQGQVATINGLYGEQLDVGLFGQHAWRQSLLGIDFRGDYYHYDNDSAYDGNGEFLNIGYTYQASRRLLFNLRGLGGSTSIGYGSPGFYQNPSEGAVVGQQSSVLFDDRIYYVQGGGDLTYILSPRTSVSFGGDLYEAKYQAAGLIGLTGYTARATLQHRLSRTKTVGFNYQHMQYDYVRSFGNSAINMGELFFSTSLGKRWTFFVAGGAFQSQVQGVEEIALNPVIAALLGQSVGFQAFNTTNYYPSGEARLIGKFKNSSVSFNYSKQIMPGNGVYLTSREDIGGASYSYTGIRRWNIGASLNYFRLESLGQTLTAYGTYGGGAGFTYNFVRSFHVVGRYDYRNQDIANVDFRRNSSRASLGIVWSPGNVPLSLW